MRITTTRKKKQIKPRHLAPVSPNTHLKELHAFYKKVSEHTSNKLVKSIEKKLRTTLSNMVPVKTSQLTNTNANKDINNNNNTINNIFVVVAKVLDDDKCVVMPKINLCCLKISKEAKEKIERFGGNVYGLDELFKFDLNDCTLISNDASRRIKCRYYGAPGEKGSNTLIKKMHKKKDVMKRPS